MSDSHQLGINVCLSAQRALWGQIPPTLRAISVDADEKIVYYRCIFDREPSDDPRELLSVAATEIIADFPSHYDIHEQYLSVPYPQKMEHLKFLVYLRYEEPIV